MRALEIQERIEEHLQAVAVDAADRLVKHEQVRRGIHGQGEQHALQLSPGAAAEGQVGQTGRVHGGESFIHPGAGLFADAGPDRAPREGGRHEIAHGQGHFPVKLQVLRNIAGAQVRDIQPAAVHMPDGAAVGQLAQQDADQRGLAGAVLADQDRELPAVDMHGHIL